MDNAGTTQGGGPSSSAGSPQKQGGKNSSAKPGRKTQQGLNSAEPPPGRKTQQGLDTTSTAAAWPKFREDQMPPATTATVSAAGNSVMDTSFPPAWLLLTKEEVLALVMMLHKACGIFYPRGTKLEDQHLPKKWDEIYWCESGEDFGRKEAVRIAQMALREPGSNRKSLSAARKSRMGGGRPSVSGGGRASVGGSSSVLGEAKRKLSEYEQEARVRRMQTSPSKVFSDIEWKQGWGVRDGECRVSTSYTGGGYVLVDLI